MAQTEEKNAYPLALDPKWEPLYPEKHGSGLYLHGGPNLHYLERCHYAPTWDEMVACAPTFHLMVPVRKKRSNARWPRREEGSYCPIGIQVVIVDSKRVPRSDSRFDILAGFLILEGLVVDEGVHISGYDTRNRRGNFSIYDRLYERVLQCWQDGHLHAVGDPGPFDR